MMGNSGALSIEQNTSDHRFFFAYALFLSDVLTHRKVHCASLVAIIFAVVISALGVAISGSDFGQEFVRNLA